VGKAIGAHVIALSSGHEKITIVLKQGADHVIDYKDGEIKDQIKVLLPGGGDVYFDPVSGASFDDTL
jgi:NADPH2:quinone reductase